MAVWPLRLTAILLSGGVERRPTENRASCAKLRRGFQLYLQPQRADHFAPMAEKAGLAPEKMRPDTAIPARLRKTPPARISSRKKHTFTLRAVRRRTPFSRNLGNIFHEEFSDSRVKVGSDRAVSRAMSSACGANFVSDPSRSRGHLAPVSRRSLLIFPQKRIRATAKAPPLVGGRALG